MVSHKELVQKRDTYQDVLIDLATNFINLPINEMDRGIVRALDRILQLLSAYGASINQLVDDGTHFLRLYAGSSHMEVKGFPRYAPMPHYAELVPRFTQGEPFSVENLADCRYPEVAALLQPYGVASIIAVPILDDKGLFGFISMTWDSPRQIEPEIRDMLRLVGCIFLNAMQRKHNAERNQRLNAELEQRVADRTSELMQINEQLQNEIVEKQQIENALRASQVQLQAIIDALPIPVTVIAEDGKLLYANPVAASMFDINLDKPVDAITVVALDEHDRLAITDELRTEGAVKDMQIHYQPTNGLERQALISIQWFQYAGQKALLVSLMDVTELKRIQVAEREQRNLTEALLDSAIALTSTLELDEVVTHILHSIRTVVTLDVANLMIIEGDDAVVLGSRGYVPENTGYKLNRRRFKYKDDFVVQLMDQTRRPVFIPDITKEPRFTRIGGGGPVLRSYLGIPIIVGQQMIGLLSLGSQAADYFTEHHARYLQMFAIQAGIAIQNARLYKQAATIAALEERQRLARELHDSVTQSLFSANSIAEALPQLINVNLEKTQHYLRDLHYLTRGAMAEMRSLLIELRPDALTQTELGILLSQLCDVFTGKTQIEVEKDVQRRITLQPDLQMTFYRIAQEALNNIAKHAQTSHVFVTLHHNESGTELRIRDDGKGFDPEQVTGQHLGLKIMRERATERQVELNIESKIDQGTEIILRSLS